MSSLIERSEALQIGVVEEVSPSKIVVTLHADSPSAIALNAGDPVAFPRINSYLLIPNEEGAIVGLVTWIGISPTPYPKRLGYRDFGLVDLPFPTRRLYLSPMGTLSFRISESGAIEPEMRRGVYSFPSVGDNVQLPTTDLLRRIVEIPKSIAPVQIGVAPLAHGAPIRVHPDVVFGRHLAILGNTGSGKSCSVAGLIRWAVESAREPNTKNPGTSHARFIVLDPNGEYSKAFQDSNGIKARVYQMDPDSDESFLALPAWMWDSREWSGFTEASSGVQKPILKKALRLHRTSANSTNGKVDEIAQYVLGYHEIFQGIGNTLPNSLATWQDRQNCKTLGKQLLDAVEYLQKSGLGDRERMFQGFQASVQGIVNKWNGSTDPTVSDVQQLLTLLTGLRSQLPEDVRTSAASEDAPITFDPNMLIHTIRALARAEGGNAAHHVEPLVTRIETLLSDERMRKIVSPEEDIKLEEWLDKLIATNPAQSGEVAIIDLSLVPADILHITISACARLVLEAAMRFRKIGKKTLPVVIVLEEAHSFIQRRTRAEDDRMIASDLCRQVFERIAREGRKFGVGMVLSSQRPSELSPTVLAQCNTYLLHRIVSDDDQRLVKQLVPDSLTGLLEELPSLPQQEAILLGAATPVPIRVSMRTLPKEQRPDSEHPPFWRVWTGEIELPLDWKPIVEDWTKAVPPSNGGADPGAAEDSGGDAT
ncbi:DUF87 domain-containing protein [Fimbriimonadia bacterium ATM]|nr:MAG: DUF87 domain-containing protein [Armatimonadota bacterium]MBC6970478.1 DUF87 domain-containing protein [Armatimonadota bacterium]MCE7899659.1 DUF87 domain-containing protein [Armatimonadetes bacterium ATM1]MDL1927744.1 DUF87 domain-containing protein [Fimbriimonadia bacterium ATM]RIJ95352.1 MAG: ATPase [Armatimonadota bacterium]